MQGFSPLENQPVSELIKKWEAATVYNESESDLNEREVYYIGLLREQGFEVRYDSEYVYNAKPNTTHIISIMRSNLRAKKIHCPEP